MVNYHLVCDPTIRQPGFDLPRQQWSLLNRFRMEQGHCVACRRKWRLTDTDLCPCGETQTMSHIVESCSLTKLNGGLSRLHSARMKTLFCGWSVMVDDTRIYIEEVAYSLTDATFHQHCYLLDTMLDPNQYPENSWVHHIFLFDNYS